MRTNHRLIRCALALACLSQFTQSVAVSAPLPYAAADESATTSENANSYKLNIGEKDAPLLGMAADHMKAGFDQSLAYPADQFDFAIFRSLIFDEAEGKYLLPTISKGNKGAAFLELARTDTPNIYASTEGIQLIEKNGSKTIKTADGRNYLFTQYPDGEFRCTTIKQADGPTLYLLYTASGLMLHGISDSSGRSLTFNYGKDGIQSLTQTWMFNSEGFTRTWIVGDQNFEANSLKFAHAVGVKSAKFLPTNAVVREYTSEMAASDKSLAQIFGGPTAVAGANGFEPAGLGAMYPLYRGDITGDDGKVRPGHLSHAIHLYGSADGRGDSPLYVPAGFTSHSSEPSPTDAAVLFYYPRLGNLTDVTLAVFHVAEFQINADGDRVRIGNIGGPGGSSPLYKHSHIEFYRGNPGLPAAAARAALRIDPATVFSVK
jgi:hypothetical protein